jgi:glucose-1-phosphate adenylyltransferase
MDLISTLPIFNLYNSDWPVYNQQINLAPAKFIRDADGNLGRTNDSIVSLGVVVTGGIVERSVLSPNVRVGSRSLVTDSILLNSARVGRDCTLRKAILDKNVAVADGASIGINRQLDIERGLTVTDSGITVVPKGLLVSP